MNKYLKFQKIKKPLDSKNEWVVLNKRDDMLGYIAWQSRWKKYAYYPDEMCFEKEIYLCQMCLKEIVKFLEEVNGDKK